MKPIKVKIRKINHSAVITIPSWAIKNKYFTLGKEYLLSLTPLDAEDQE